MSAYKELEKRFSRMNDMEHALSIIGWDEAVMMTPGGGESRANSISTLHVLAHQMITDPKLEELFSKAETEKDLSDWEKSNLKKMKRSWVQENCMPADLVEAMSKASTKCEQAWRVMRAENDWKGFKPLLEEVFSLVKREAEIKSEKFNLSKYDALLEKFDPGARTADIDPVFEDLKSFLPDFLKKVLEKQKSVPQLSGKFSIESQKQLGLELMKDVGFDFKRGRLDVSHHPFCGGVPQDIRITTRYDEADFTKALMGVLHETGHAKYEQNLPKDWLDQPVGGSLGMSVHESQSLLMEMQVCRSREFLEFSWPKIKKAFSDVDLRAWDVDNLYRFYTLVKPGYIRVDADEVTYPLHVILRYEIEKKLFNDEITIDDLPLVWNEYMTKFLGISTKGNDKDGCMQDVHWPSAGFGYFPTYTLGAISAAQQFAAIKKENKDVLKQISRGEFDALNTWLREKIHSKGSLMDSPDLLKSATGSTLDAKFFKEHLETRYLN